jgi:serine/threonine-protein kinase
LLQDLEDYLLEWEERRERGEALSPDDLCPHWPEGQAELARRIELLEACDRLLDVEAEAADKAAAPAPPQGIGGYEVHGELGRGGMGVVYRVWDPVLRREAALKMVRPAGRMALPGLANELELRFQREAQALAQLKHEHIVPIFEAKLENGVPYFVMEFVAGGSLSARRAELTAAGPREIVPFVEKIARAVHHAHGKGILHRDLKPANILLDAEAQPRVSDFGLAKLLSAEVDPDADTVLHPKASPAGTTAPDALTHPGHQPGTPAYMAPEQFDSAFGPVSPATDVWALGVILYELLTGQKPFAGSTREELRGPVSRTAPARPRSLRRAVDRRLDDVVLRCLAKEPGQRFASAGALADELARWRRPRRLVKWVVASLTVLVLVLAAWLVADRSGKPPNVVIVPAPKILDPYEHYVNDVRPALEKLRAGVAVEVIQPNRVPPYYVREDAGGTRVGATEEGLRIFTTSVAIIEFLPRAPSQPYELVVEMRHDAVSNPSFFRCGPYCEGAHFATAKGKRHFVPMVRFNDCVRENLPPLGQLAAFQLLYFGLPTPPDGARPYVHHDLVELPYVPFRLEKGDKKWRKIVFQVAAHEVKARWFAAPEGDKGRAFPVMTHAKYRAAFEQMRNLPQDEDRVADLQDVAVNSLEFATHGIVLACGQCTIRRMTLVPRGPSLKKEQ